MRSEDRTSRQRTIRCALRLLGTSVALNILVAWTCAGLLASGGAARPTPAPVHWVIDVPDPWPAFNGNGGASAGRGWRHETQVMTVRRGESHIAAYEVQRFRAGWPLLALGSSGYRAYEGPTPPRYGQTPPVAWSPAWRLGAPIGNSWIRFSRSFGRAPLLPAPVGFIGNTLIYAGGLWIMLCVRSRLRIHRGRCAACRAHLGELETCPECGRPRCSPGLAGLPLRLPMPGRAAIGLAVCALIAGAGLNVVIAWACVGPPRAERAAQAGLPAFHIAAPSSAPRELRSTSQTSRVGVDTAQELLGRWEIVEGERLPLVGAARTAVAGLPFRSVRWAEHRLDLSGDSQPTAPGPLLGGLPAPAALRDAGWFALTGGRLPIAPILPGFLLNTLIYTAALAAPIGLLAARRRSRNDREFRELHSAQSLAPAAMIDLKPREEPRPSSAGRFASSAWADAMAPGKRF